MSVFRSRPSARVAAVVASVALLSVLPRDAAAQTSSIVNVEVLQPGPGRIHEDYRAGSDILVSVTVVIPVGAPAAGLYLSIEAGDLHPVVFAPRFSTAGVRQWCRNSTNSPKVSVDADLLIVDDEWMNGTHPGAAALISDGQGSSSGVTISDGDDPNTGGAAERTVVYSVAFAVVCDDDLVEPDEQFTIRAWLTPANMMGRSAPTGAVARSVLIIDDDTLRPPHNLVLSLSGTTVTASWDQPEGTGSVQPDGYILRYREVGPGDTGWQEITIPGGDTLTHDVTGLTRGSTYRFQVRSTRTNSRPSEWSTEERISITVVTDPAPGVPRDLSLAANDTSLVLSWNEPANHRDFPGLTYEVEFRQDGGPWFSTGVVISGTSASLTGARGSSYRARVRAGAGGAWSVWVPAGPVTVPELPVPGAPLNLRLASASGDLVVTWDEPADIDSVPVTGYTLRFRGTGIDDKWRTEDVSAGTLRFRIPASYGLEYGGTYRAQVRASGAGGDGPWSAEAETTLEEITVPGPPLMVTGTWSGTALTVRWREPANAAADDFEIQHYSVGLARADWVSDPQDVTPDRALEAVFDDSEIWPGCTYAITVTAHATTDAPNAPTILEGDPAKIEYMPGQPPCAQREVPRGAPRSLHVTRDAGMAITVAWDVWSPPADPAGVSVVYGLEVADPDETVVQNLAGLSGPAHTVTDLELYVDYRFRIRAGFRYNQAEPVQYGPWSPRARRYSEDARLEVEIGDDQEFEYATEYDTLGFSVRLSGETPRPVSVRIEVFQNGSREPVDVSAGQPFYGLSSGNGGRLDFLPGLPRDPWIYADFHEGLNPTDQILIVLSEPDPPGFLRLGDRSRLQCTGAGVCGATPVPTLAPAGALILAVILAGFGCRRTRG